MKGILHFIAIYQWVCSNDAMAYTLTDAENLETTLTSAYRKTLRPSDVTNIGVSAGLLHISYLDIVTQQMDMVGFLQMNWKDTRLSWTPTTYGNMNYTFLLKSDIWTPPLVLNNAANGLKILNDDADMVSTYASVLYDGTVYWLTAANFISQCIVDIKYYPFDIQDCHMIVTPWGFSSEEITLYSSFTSMNMALYEENGEWDVAAADVYNYSRTVGTQVLSSVKITLQLHRKYSYYLITLLIPVILLALLGPLVFVLPVESGEKNGFALTILLSLSVVMTILSDHIPPISTQTCLLSIYLLIVFIICTLETALTVLSCQIHAYTAKGYTPGHNLQTFVRTVAAICLFRRPDSPEAAPKADNSPVRSKQSQVNTVDSPRKKKGAWTEEGAVKHDDVEELIVYTYEECAFIMDRMNFVLFFVVNVIATAVLLTSITAGAG